MELERSLRIQFCEAEVLSLADLGGRGAVKSNPSFFFFSLLKIALMMELNTTQPHYLGLELES